MRISATIRFDMSRTPKYVLKDVDLGSESVGQRISHIRKKQGLTQQQIGELIGIQPYLVSDYETGRLRISDEILARFAIALKVSADVLLGVVIKDEYQFNPSRRTAKRMQRLEQLPETEQRTVIQALDALLDLADRVVQGQNDEDAEPKS